jgi:hypothetical protein
MNRLRMVCVVACVLAGACACKAHKDAGHGGGTGTGTGSASCDGIKAHVEALYRAEVTGDNVDEQVADNTQMVLTDCAAQPDKVARCAADAKSVADLEQRCLIPLDEEGTEGDRFKGGK